MARDAVGTLKSMFTCIRTSILFYKGWLNMDMQALTNDLKFATSWMELRLMSWIWRRDRFGPILGSKPTSMNVLLFSKILSTIRKLLQVAWPPLPRSAPSACETMKKQMATFSPTCPSKIATTLGESTASCRRQEIWFKSEVPEARTQDRWQEQGQGQASHQDQ